MRCSSCDERQPSIELPGTNGHFACMSSIVFKTFHPLACGTVLALAASMCACSPPPVQPREYERNQAATLADVVEAKVVHVRHVTILATEKTQAIGAATGAAAATLSTETGSEAKRVLRGAAGAAGGSLLAAELGSAPGIEITVRLADGRLKSLVQGLDQDNPIKAGDRVGLVVRRGRVFAFVLR